MLFCTSLNVLWIKWKKMDFCSPPLTALQRGSFELRGNSAGCYRIAWTLLTGSFSLIPPKRLEQGERRRTVVESRTGTMDLSLTPVSVHDYPQNLCSVCSPVVKHSILCLSIRMCPKCAYFCATDITCLSAACKTAIWTHSQSGAHSYISSWSRFQSTQTPPDTSSSSPATCPPCQPGKVEAGC